MATPHQTQTDPPTRKAVISMLRSKSTDRVAVNKDMLNLMAETTMQSPVQNSPSKSKKKEKRAADNATASAPSTAAVAGQYTSEVYKVVELIEAAETNASTWFDPHALETIKFNCLESNLQKINEFPEILAQSVQSLQKEVDKHKENFEGLKEAADHFLELEGPFNYKEDLELGMELTRNGVSACQEFVDGLKAVLDTLPLVETQSE
ncbi:hypothetical protein KC343_g128 [Hortaea werneckii]|nr:hypothetical protein KC352_g1238 [Hortaea werneckii]KAI7573120.1 hypothetical protein KC317_g148 [Hortaea werneckii]KAI7628531.1 hypothetical protein KC346_g124 [Hortaea werneckii]KAI7638348.1 hypothetical protein KC343_g128 [Hortaea werneckii]KAI7683981.1 hypothetical protein KC319_g155 [Hortaea werneckii]